VTREDRRLYRRLFVVFVVSIGGLIAVGAIDLWLYPPPVWLKGDAWYASNICKWHGQIMTCAMATNGCIAENLCFGPPSQ
jgi:hypothetical protein